MINSNHDDYNGNNNDNNDDEWPGVDEAGIIGIALVRIDTVIKNITPDGFVISSTTRKNVTNGNVDGSDENENHRELEERAQFFRPTWWLDECPITNKPIIPWCYVGNAVAFVVAVAADTDANADTDADAAMM